MRNLFSQTNFDRAIIASLTDKEFIKIHEELKKVEHAYFDNEKGFICTLPYEKIVQMVSKERREGIMKVAEHLNPKFICAELQSTSKEDAIKELAGLIKDCREINDFDQFLKDVFEREEMMSTGIGDTIAVPHARTDAVNKLIIAMGRSHAGVDFKSIDKKPVNLIFLLGTPAKEMGDYLRILSYLTRVLMKEDFRQRLLDANGPEEIIEIFANKENHTS